MRKSGVSVSTFYSRRRIGWSVASAATTPPGQWRHPNSRLEATYSHDGRSMSLAAWARELGMAYTTLVARIGRGLSFAEAIEHPRYGKLPDR